MYKKYFDKKKLIIFDLDGTIANTRPIRIQAFDKVLDEIKNPLNKTANYLNVGNTLYSTWKFIKNTFDIDKKYKIKDLVKKTDEETARILNKKETELRPLEGFWDLFYELKEKNYLTAVATNSSRITLDATLKKLELDGLFDFTISLSEIKKPKPHPEIYKKVLKHFKLKPKDALVFEDSIVGAKAATKAKIDTLIIWNLQNEKYKYPNAVKEFFFDYESFPGNLDITYVERFVKFLEANQSQK